MNKRTVINEKEAAVRQALNELRTEIEALGKESFFMHWPNTIVNLNRQIDFSLKNIMIVVDKMLRKEEKDHEK